MMDAERKKRLRLLWRYAAKIKALKHYREFDVSTLSQGTLQTLASIQKQAARLNLAATVFSRERLSKENNLFMSSLYRLHHVHERRQTELSKAGSSESQKDMFLDLVALEDEFDNVVIEISSDRFQIRATTDPITLEDIRLGSFTIQLDMVSSLLKIFAEDANPAESDEYVIHPHVKDNELCQGDAGSILQKAFKSGRLLDFFLAVDRTLKTYNPDSPHIDLASWGNLSCRDCGDIISSGDEDHCNACDRCMCDSCVAACSHCMNSFCHDCRQPCESCNDDLCASCYDESTRCDSCESQTCETCNKTCEDCDTTLCTSCKESDERCRQCAEQHEEAAIAAKRTEEETERGTEEQHEEQNEQITSEATESSSTEEDPHEGEPVPFENTITDLAGILTGATRADDGLHAAISSVVDPSGGSSNSGTRNASEVSEDFAGFLDG